MGMYAVRADVDGMVDGLQTRQPGAVSRGEAAAVLERTVPLTPNGVCSQWELRVYKGMCVDSAVVGI